MSRLEARRLARERYEADRLRRAREERGATQRRLEQAADERAEARVRELLDRGARGPGPANDPEGPG